MSEVELKAVVDDPAALTARLARGGAARTFRGLMTDRRFDLPSREMLARDHVLRLRTFAPVAGGGGGDAHAELAWKGPTRRSGGYKEREELQFDVGDAAATQEVLTRLGYEVSDAIDRCVEYYSVADAVVRVEWYPRMDVLVEVEGRPADIERAVEAAGIARDCFTADRLLDFAGRYQERTGRPAALALSALVSGERPAWPAWAPR